MSTVWDYNNNFELLFKNLAVLKFNVEALTILIDNVSCSQALIDPNIRQKLNHYFLCQINHELFNYYNGQVFPQKLYSYVCGYSVTRQPQTTLSLYGNNSVCLNTHISNVLINGVHTAQYLQNSLTHIIYTSTAQVNYISAPGFFEGFYSHINELSKNDLSGTFSSKLETVDSLKELIDAINEVNKKVFHDHTDIGIKLTSTKAKVSFLKPADAGKWVKQQIGI